MANDGLGIIIKLVCFIFITTIESAVNYYFDEGQTRSLTYYNLVHSCSVPTDVGAPTCVYIIKFI